LGKEIIPGPAEKRSNKDGGDSAIGKKINTLREIKNKGEEMGRRVL